MCVTSAAAKLMLVRLCWAWRRSYYDSLLPAVLEKKPKMTPRCPNCGSEDPKFTDVALEEQVERNGFGI
jgi:hypothetical protein